MNKITGMGDTYRLAQDNRSSDILVSSELVIEMAEAIWDKQTRASVFDQGITAGRSILQDELRELLGIDDQ
tara:strand:- start:488 stop:700 length:213 start_codon:yes stop_codon:yes gene_type:complete